MCQPKCLMGLSTAQDRAASECPKATCSSPCKRLPRRSFHTDVCEENIACTTFVVGALVATIVGMMFVECFYMVGILPVCQALALLLQQVVLWCLASNSDTSFAPEPSISVGLGGLEKAFLTQDTEGMEVIPVVRAIAAGLFYFFARRTFSRSASWGCPRPKFSQQSSVPKASFSLPSMYTRESFTRSHVEVSASLGLWVPVHAGVFPRRSFHADDCDDIIARAIFAVGALVAMVVGTVQVFHAYTCDDPLWNLFPGEWFSEAASASCLIERNRTPLFG